MAQVMTSDLGFPLDPVMYQNLMWILFLLDSSCTFYLFHSLYRLGSSVKVVIGQSEPMTGVGGQLTASTEQTVKVCVCLVVFCRLHGVGRLRV